MATITDITFDFNSHETLAPGSDNWPITWSDDGHQYTSWGDGGGFGGTNSKGRVSLGFARLEGDHDNFTAYNVWGGKNPENPATFEGKSYGIVSIGGVLYMWNMVEDHYFEKSELYYSNDKGATWISAGWGFENLQSAFSVPTILNFGQDYAGARDDYVYVYAPGEKDLAPEGGFPGANRFNSADGVDLARVHKDQILQENAYEFFAGLDGQGNPQWTSNVANRQPVLSDPGQIHWTMQVAYLPVVDQYLLFNNRGPGFDESGKGGKLDIYQADEPWGDWTLLESYSNWGGFGYTFTYYIAPKWISADGKDFTLIFSGNNSEDSWNTVRGSVVVDDDSLTLSSNTGSVAENDGTGAATLTVTRQTADLSQPLTVNLSSDDTSELQTPAQVTILANQASANFQVDAIDDTLLDGTQNVTVTASATGMTPGTEDLTVTDHETLTLTINDSAIAENGGAAATTGTVTRSNTDTGSSLVVTLSSDDTSEATVPATVTIQSGQASATFDIDAVDDTLLDGTQSVTISASASGYTGDGESLDITDHETLTLTITDSAIAENGGAAATTGTVTRSNTDTGSSLVVTLSSDDTSEATVPATVTIQSGQASATFDIDAVDDTLLDGTQSVTISASASGYTGDGESLDVTDHEALTLTITDSAIAENGGAAATTGTVTRSNTDTGSNLVVTLSSDDTSEATVPATVTIQSGQASATFDIDAVDDTLLDGTQSVTISASASGYTGDGESLDVTDHETLTVSIVAAEIAESDGPAATTATVTRSNTDNAQALVVTLVNGDDTEISIPASVTILASQSSATFDVGALTDALIDGSQSASVTASASGYVAGQDSVTVTDTTSVNWGTVEWMLQSDQSLAGTHWWHFTALRDATLTVDAAFAHASGNVDLELYDSGLQLLDSSNSETDGERVDTEASAGALYYLRAQGTNGDVDFRLANLVDWSGTRVDVYGTSSDDSLAFTAGAQHQVDVKGLVYTFDPASATTFHLHGQGGSDVATLTGSAGLETAVLQSGDATVTGTNYDVSTTGSEDLRLHSGGGADTATLYDGPNDDTFYSTRTYSWLDGPGYYYQVDGYSEVMAMATGGGTDVGYLYDTNADDVFYGQGSRRWIEGAGFKNTADGFDRVEAYSVFNGSDTAYFYDTAADDEFYGKSDRSWIEGGGFYSLVQGFASVEAYAMNGGNDVAYLYDSPADEVFYGKGNRAWIELSNVTNYVQDFESVEAYAMHGGNDIAYLYDGPNDDEFYGKANRSWIEGPGFDNYAQDFDRVEAYAINGGNNTAYLYDTSSIDEFYGKGNRAWIDGGGSFNYAQDFDRVDAYSINGGQDLAYLYDTTSDDVFYGKGVRAWMAGGGSFNYAQDFAAVDAYSIWGGQDVAYLYDAASNDTFYGKSYRAWIEGPGFRNYAQDFLQVNAYAVYGGVDTAYLYDSPSNDVFYSKDHRTWIEGPGFHNYAQSFESVNAYALYGGDDTAYIYDTAADDIVYAQQDRTWIVSLASNNYSQGFEVTNVYSTLGGYDRMIISGMSTGDLLSALGSDVNTDRSGVELLGRNFDFVQAVALVGQNPDADVQAIDYLLELIGDWI